MAGAAATSIAADEVVMPAGSGLLIRNKGHTRVYLVSEFGMSA
jgi:hypothetical protein